ncbi:CMRF35-like molecule 5 [Lagopus muta]|uniref:CMRF35-like molecule 5 n=1 Tax=Lagopus muta TaxID=64668 RepID=UPI0020A114A4|nr:CMRF35-like molecule 5 [Lagopus muta]
MPPGAPRGKAARTLMCCFSPLVLWGFSAVCQALVVSREVSGREGETLSLRCWYARGYEGYNKYWCRGAARGSCHKVVETAGREVPRQNGRVSITDNHVFCVVLLTVEELCMEDAGSYWCGVERAGRDIMEPVTVRVRPAIPTAPSPEPWLSNTTTEFPHTTNFSAAGAGLQKENISLQKGQEPPSSPPNLSRPALQVLLPTVMLLFLLAVAGSAGLIHALRRRRRSKEALQKPLGLVGSSQLRSLAVQAQQHHHPGAGQAAGDTPPPRTKGLAAPKQPGDTTELDAIYDNELHLRKVRARPEQCWRCREVCAARAGATQVGNPQGTRTDSSDTEEQRSELGDDRIYINS